MVRVSDVLGVLNSLAPVERKMDFDNVGLLVGWPDAPVERVLVSLDITADVAREAEESGAQLVVSHHPLFFSLKAVRSDEPIGETVLTLAGHKISAICMHTNLDVSRGGVNDALAEALGLKNIECLSTSGVDETGMEYGLGRLGVTEKELDLKEYLSFVKNRLRANGLRYADAGRKVTRVAVCGGSGGSELKRAVDMGCDTYITADVKYNTFLDALDFGINLIDAGHFPTENVVIAPVARLISGAFPELKVTVSKVHGQPEKFFC